MQETSKTLNLLMFGDAGAGKRSLRLRFTDNHYQEAYTSEQKVNVKTCTLECDEQSVTLNVTWMPAQTRFSPMINLTKLTRRTDGYMLCYDCTDQESFNNIQKYYRDIERYGKDGSRIILVATKTDSPPARQVVSVGDARRLADRLGIPFIETSAKTGHKVEEAFWSLTSAIILGSTLHQEQAHQTQALQAPQQGPIASFRRWWGPNLDDAVPAAAPMPADTSAETRNRERPPQEFFAPTAPNRQPAPADFCCPITHEAMTDPVSTADGHSYERNAIERWFQEGNRTSPKTGLKLEEQTLTPNHALRNAIESYQPPQDKSSCVIA